MVTRKPPASHYQQLEANHTAALQLLVAKRNRIGWLRLIAIVLTIILGVKTYSTSILILCGTLVTGIGIFLFLVKQDVNNNHAIAHLERLLFINKEELLVLENRYRHRFDGSLFLPPDHAYANDLDVFGPASLYQYINRCHGDGGRALLAQNLLYGLPIHEIQNRQAAITELAPQLQWRQQLQSVCMHTPVTSATQQKAVNWLAGEASHFTHRAWPSFVLVYSILTLATGLAALTGFIPLSLFSGLFGLYFVFATALSARATKAYTQLNGIVGEFGTLAQTLQLFEEKTFNAALLNELQQSIKNPQANAHGEIKKLNAILNRFDMRLNVYVFLFLNAFLLWDARQMIALNAWRRRNKAHIRNWFDAIAQIEVLNSLATLHFNQPGWAWPQFTEDHFTFRGTAVGHPLIPEPQRVCNDFHFQGTGRVALITGSNMAGKSTFLRSLGTNIVLAQLGAPVCAQRLILSPVRVMSSMRIADNLAENTSTFYAELKKLKGIIEAVKGGEKIFILLDEVLRGTNSLDRHTGSKALVRQIINKRAVAVIATHDVEMAKLEAEQPATIDNYHFDVQVEKEELYFDYKLKRGVCTSLNASLLMKKIGIELEPES